jgi:hypothetical protein
MSRVLRPGLVLALPVVWLSSLARADSAPEASRWIPREAYFVVEVARPKAVLDLALGPKMTGLVTSQPAFKHLEAQGGYQQFAQIVQFIEGQIGTDWKDALRTLTSGGVTLAALPEGNSILIIETDDEALLVRLHEVLLAGARDEAQKQGQPDRVKSKEYKGVTAWTFDGKEVHAVIGKRLVYANKGEAFKAVLDLRDQPGETSLASVPAYKAAKAAVGSKAATAFANMSLIKHAPKIEEALKNSGNPLGELLFAGIKEALAGSTWLALGLEVKGETLDLEAITDAKVGGADSATAFAWPTRAGAGALPNFAVPRQIAAASLYRDLHTFYAAKDKLFPERTSGLIFFENMMGIFFSGRDLTGEIFGATLPEVRLVVAAQQYDPKVGTPQVQIPAFALVFHLRNPEEFQAVAEEAWQKAVGLITVTRGQRAEPGLLIDREEHAGVKYSVAYNSLGKDEDKTHLASRFNFRPSLARVGEFLVVSSTDGLTNDLIDALKDPSQAPHPLAGTNTIVAADGVALASILKADRASLVSQNMVEKGHTQEQAEGEIDFITTIAKHLGHATLTGDTRDGRPRFNLEVKLNLP